MPFNKVDMSLPADFKSIVRLFPLPNLVVFPGVIQCLHIFEPRYRQLMLDTLAADQLITMAVMKPQWEKTGSTSPEIFRTVTIGKILTQTQLDDGRFNLLLLGSQRAKITTELPTEKPYRLAEVELLTDYCDATEEKESLLRESLIKEFRTRANLEKQIDREAVENLVSDDVPLGLICDLICYSLGLSVEKQIKVLETMETSCRAEMVLEFLREKPPTIEPHGIAANFPPDFSVN